MKELDVELLIDTMVNMKNKESMVYWLEFKNDDEFKTNSTTYGSVSGGSSLKYIMFERNRDDNWVSESPQKQIVLELYKAIDIVING